MKPFRNVERVKLRVGGNQGRIGANMVFGVQQPLKFMEVVIGESELLKLVGDLLGPFLDAWSHRNERNAVKDAGSLTFWSDGMLEQLRLIADRRATTETFTELEKQFLTTDAPMSHAMDTLRTARNRIGSGEAARKIDEILNHKTFGRTTVRENISKILNHRNSENLPHFAQDACTSIVRLNSEIDRLRRIVYG